MQNPILFFLSSLIKLLSSQIVLERKTWPTIGSFSWIFVLEPTVSCRQENAERNAKSQLVASRGEGKVHAGGLRKPRPPRCVPDHAGRSRSLSAIPRLAHAKCINYSKTSVCLQRVKVARGQPDSSRIVETHRRKRSWCQLTGQSDRLWSTLVK